MKKFKQIDFWISTGLILFFILINIVGSNTDVLSDRFIGGYFVVGGWQVISMIVHAVTQTFIRPVGARYTYHWIAFISVATMPVGSFFILLYTAPFMAVYYTWLCYSELKKMNERPLAGLK